MAENSELTIDQDQTLVGHLRELRGRLIRAALAVIFCSLGFYMVSDPIMNEVQSLIAPVLPEGKLIFISPVESFLMQIQFSLFLGLLAALPVVFYQMWAFIHIALYPNEKSFLNTMLFSSLFSFYLGGSFSYFVALPFSIHFLVVGSIFKPMISVNRYYTFIIYSTLVFGIIFETPLVIFTGNKVGLLSIQMVKDFRRYAILFIFVFAGLFSPPDVFSQFLVAIPMILLYEFGILLCQFFGRPDPQKEEESSEN